MNDDTDALLAQADRAVAIRDFATASSLLARASALEPDDVAILLKLAGLKRAAGDPGSALERVHQALAVRPLDFTALLMRASLLDAIADTRSGQAWNDALAQRPTGGLPVHLASAVRLGEQRRDEWIALREVRMIADMASAEGRADEVESKRIARFRNNVLRKTRVYHSEPTHFAFPELAEREFHPRHVFPWLGKLERAAGTIAGEFRSLTLRDRADIAPYINYPSHLPLSQWKALNNNRDWSAIHLLKNGERVANNADQCPQTMALLATLPQPGIARASPNAMFSLLAPGTAIPPHVGVSNARLVCHLPIDIPDGCWFRVGEETRVWRLGEAFVFDDTIEHEALNPSDRLRVVFIFDIWHPDLSAVEREAVTALLESEQSGGAGL